MAQQRIISPSFLAADLLHLERDAKIMNESAAEWFHLDIMDGNFVPNISFGLPMVKTIRQTTDKVLDVHLMIEKPELYVKKFRDAGADFLTVHVEASVHLYRTLQEIREAGMKAGVALNPSTPVSAIEEVAGIVDMVLVMTVNPGFGGQEFIPTGYEKIRHMRRLLDEKGSEALIQVDGGVTSENAGKIFDAGCNVIVSGSAIFNSPDPKQAILDLLNA